MRRLPVYLLIETSGGMRGERIEAVKNGLQILISKLRQDPFALESVYISIITFDRNPKEIVPLTDLVSLQLPNIEIPESSPPHTGRVLSFLHAKLKQELIQGNAETKGDWRPLLFILTRGSVADKEEFRVNLPLLKQFNFATMVACMAGSNASENEMKELAEHVIQLDTADSSTLVSFFKWVSDSIGVGNKSVGTSESVALPPPPAEVNIIV